VTLIIGARGRDGITIGTDRKEMRGTEATYGNKIFEINNVVLGIAGLTGIRDDFLLLLRDRMRAFRNLYEVKLEVEDIIGRLSERYKSRIGEEEPISAIMGGLVDLTGGEAKLYHILGRGYGEEIDFLCLGSGARYAHSLAKFLYNSRDNAESLAKKIAFAISWVSEDVDVTVGGTPHIVIVRDKQPKPIYLKESVMKEMEKKAGDYKKDLISLFKL